MKNLRKFLSISALIMMLFAFSGCRQNTDDVVNEEEAPPTEEEHIGCQEDEIILNGECVPADENNAALFEKDLTGFVESETIDLENVSGFFARPTAEGDYPGVVMIHEWWGLNENIKYMAELLASEGYNVFAVDLYDGEVAENSEQAGALAGSVRENPEAAVMKMQEAVAYLKEQAMSERVASLGWCFGGQQSLNLSLSEPLDGTVIYYGHLVEDKEQLDNLAGPVLGIFGAEDSSISVESVNSFDQALDELEVVNDIYIYDGVGHAFANPSGSNYAPEQTKDAWAKTLEFLKSNLK